MAERWHQETNSFHLSVGKMTITLDDVACVLGIPVAGRLIQEDDLDPDHDVELMVTHLLFPVEDAVEQVSNNSGAFVTYTALKERYEHVLNRSNHLLGEDLQRRRRSWVILGPHVSRRFCCSCLATPFLPARTTKPLICCGCLRFRIWLK